VVIARSMRRDSGCRARHLRWSAAAARSECARTGPAVRSPGPGLAWPSPRCASMSARALRGWRAWPQSPRRSVARHPGTRFEAAGCHREDQGRTQSARPTLAAWQGPVPQCAGQPRAHAPAVDLAAALGLRREARPSRCCLSTRRRVRWLSRDSAARCTTAVVFEDMRRNYPDSRRRLGGIEP
jgi:hypothetical protein